MSLFRPKFPSVGHFLRSAALLAPMVFLAAATSARADLIGLYQFNDASNLGKDTSGHNNDATNVGALFTASGYQDGGASFNGSAYLRSPINASVSALPQMTWGAWTKPNLTSDVRTVLSSDDGSFDREIDLEGRFGPTSWATFTGSTIYYSGVAPSTTDYTFLAAVYDQTMNSLTFYVNGQSFNISNTSFGSSQSFFDIGHNPSFGEFFNGTIDNVFVYNEALSSTQVANIRANGFSASAAVPEPAFYAMSSLLALGGSGLLVRRRKVRAG